MRNLFTVVLCLAVVCTHAQPAGSYDMVINGVFVLRNGKSFNIVYLGHPVYGKFKK